jgi:methylated-DNA-protein-cysteine methyltransferase-like protein
MDRDFRLLSHPSSYLFSEQNPPASTPEVKFEGMSATRAKTKSAKKAPAKKTPMKSSAAMDPQAFQKAKRQILRDSARSDEPRDVAFRRMILSIPAGRVSTYGKVAAAAGYPQYHRAVARLLRTDPLDSIPWHRVLGAGGEVKLPGESAREQRARLKLEGVKFKGDRVDMETYEHAFRTWEVYE